MRFAALLGLLVILGTSKVAHDTLSAPIERRVTLEWPGLPTSVKNVRIVLLADIHVAGPDMPPSRLERIVKQVNALKPDLVFVAGDFVSDKRTATRHFSTRKALAPLGELVSTSGVIAVPGNHDHWRNLDDIAVELERHNVRLLQNQVVESAGLHIAGLDDDFTGHANLGVLLSNDVEARVSPMLILSHSPDPFPDLPQATGIMLAGHTHCGQIGWPWGGSPATMSRYGELYSCGIVEEKENILVTTAGLGTSVLPFRLFTRPEIWIVDLETTGSSEELGAAPVR